MIISLTIPESNTVTTHGYGVAAHGMVNSLLRLGHRVPFQDPDAKIEIAFCQPDIWEWSSPDSYKIGYVPWESTKLPDRWLAPLREVDEIWTTSPWCKKVFEKNGFQNVRVYQHGVDTGPEGWTRKRRERRGGRLKFLHIGEPAPRKGGQMVYDIFMENFANDPDVSLTFKSNGYNTVRGKDGKRPEHTADNIEVITDEYETWAMIDLVKRHDVLIYPSWGEGFGLIPLQAMATAMPVISTAPWAPYRAFLNPELVVKSKLTNSPWPEMHPGFLYEPDRVDLTQKMLAMTDPDQFFVASTKAFQRSFAIENAYDWDRLTDQAFEHLEGSFD